MYLAINGSIIMNGYSVHGVPFADNQNTLEKKRVEIKHLKGREGDKNSKISSKTTKQKKMKNTHARSLSK